MVRFLGNALPDPLVAGAPWSDPVLQALYDAVHAAALCLARATSLLHEAKVDVVKAPTGMRAWTPWPARRTVDCEPSCP